jgi:S-DNA-T family DNA segregation ATPase FtsK/SpoIIIE
MVRSQERSDTAMALSRASLNEMCNRIETVLTRHRLQVRVEGATVTPRLLQFHLLTPVGVKVNKITGLSEEIALALNSREARVYRSNGKINVEVPRRNTAPIKLLPLCQEIEAPAATAILGVESTGAPLLLRLPSPDVVHILIAGTTGSGKTALARTLLASLAYFNAPSALQMILIDPKGRGFGPLAQLPHVQGKVVATPDEGAARLAQVVAEMERRDHANLRAPLLVVAIDELADLLQTGGKAVEGLRFQAAWFGPEDLPVVMAQTHVSS